MKQNNATPYKILVVGPSWVGDMIMAQTLFKLLKQQHPNSIIDVLAPGHSAPVVTRMPEIRKLIDLPIKHRELALLTRYRLGKALRAEHYDQAIVMPRSYKSALIPFIARIPKRTGWIGECRYGLLNDIRRLDEKKLPLCVQRFAAHAFPNNAPLPAELPWPRLTESPLSLASTLSAYPVPVQAGQPILALCPGAAFGEAKRWPAEHYAAVAQEKLKQGWAVWLFGSSVEKVQTQQIQELCQGRCIDLAGALQLTQTIDLLSCVSAVVANDSGLMHISAALEKPLVVVYGSTSPKFTPPLSTEVKMVSLGLSCSPCFKRVCPLGHLNC
ncbi:MAG TPA: lipopolysaccharide heptosyltransferase II, partial [Gammaproteobacteria bacterium]|nr:lipopolysaccharide heptosyltransferase II [Gammaproteobacteria bacterium]